MKFSALNVDFSSPSPDPLDSKRPAQVGVKEGHPSKKWLSAVVLSSVKMVADRQTCCLSQQALATSFLEMSTLMTLNPKKY